MQISAFQGFRLTVATFYRSGCHCDTFGMQTIYLYFIALGQLFIRLRLHACGHILLHTFWQATTYIHMSQSFWWWQIVLQACTGTSHDTCKLTCKLLISHANIYICHNTSVSSYIFCIYMQIYICLPDLGWKRKCLGGISKQLPKSPAINDSSWSTWPYEEDDQRANAAVAYGQLEPLSELRLRATS